MSACLYCGSQIAEGTRRLDLDGTLTWTAEKGGRGSAEETAFRGHAQFCSIRCLGTQIGVTLEKRGLIPPKPAK